MDILNDLDFLETLVNGGETIARVRAEVERLQAIKARLIATHRSAVDHNDHYLGEELADILGIGENSQLGTIPESEGERDAS